MCHDSGSLRAAFSFGAKDMKNRLNLFAQIAKIDESKHEVWGIATAEVIDKEGEIFDYDSSKPYFKKWSDEIAKATDGKSLGNVREMHAPSAVGKLVAIDFDDDLKQVRVGARIVDSAAWQKCMQGVYTGFSIGGACTNGAESYFSRLRRGELGHHHHIAGPYLVRYAREAAWREDFRRVDNGEQIYGVVRLAMRCRPSVDFCGYWQRARS